MRVHHPVPWGWGYSCFSVRYRYRDWRSGAFLKIREHYSETDTIKGKVVFEYIYYGKYLKLNDLGISEIHMTRKTHSEMGYVRLKSLWKLITEVQENVN